MTEPSNVVLITIDCLRADHLPMYGYDRDTSPFLAELAGYGTLFERTYAVGPGTSVSFPGIFTSTYPFDYGGYNGLGEERTHVMRVLDEETLTTTLGVHSNPYLSHHYGYDQGYDQYVQFVTETPERNPVVELVANNLSADSLTYRSLQYMFERLQTVVPTSDPDLPRGERITEVATDWVTEGLTAPFCLWVHYMDVHSPHNPPADCIEPFRDSVPDLETHRETWTRLARQEEVRPEDVHSLVDVYDASIRYVDQQLEQLFSALETLPSFEETLFVITADHGEEFGEYGQLGHAEPHVYEELTRVPLVIYQPGRDSHDSVSTVTSLIDIAPTILEVFGVTPPADYRGRSLLPVIDGHSREAEPVFSEVCHTEGGSDVGTLKLEEAMVACRTADSSCIKNFRNATVEGATELEKEIDNHLDALYTATGTRDVAVPSEVEDRLADLGYVDR